ncbi:MAG TPA: 16S rRNA (uracil(1498)-N(3))-methyltransferase [Steroidobacteraceae bacterium]
MRQNRVYVDEALSADTLVEIGGAAANHITRVLRLKAGDAITTFDGRGGEYEARIDAMRKDRVLVLVGAYRAVERESPLAVTLAQGVSRGERMDFVVQKATELGVRRIVPLITERSVVRLDSKQAEAKVRHWRAVVIAACEQCGRNILPELSQPRRLETLLARPDAPLQRLVLSPHGEQRMGELDIRGPVLVLIGPEGGLSESELSAALRTGFRAVRLGPRILRTETAALAALAALQQQVGDL